MNYSKVIDPAFKVKRVNVVPLLNGSAVIQELGYIERKTYRFFWINASELEAEIENIQTIEAGSGWAMEGEPSMAPVHEVIGDLFNVQINLHRFLES